VPPHAEKSRDFTGLVEAVQCSSTSLAQCMRHALLDIFAPSCLDMHVEYILTHFDKHLLYLSSRIHCLIYSDMCERFPMTVEYWPVVKTA
jgi:hypothetical protein